MSFEWIDNAFQVLVLSRMAIASRLVRKMCKGIILINLITVMVNICAV